MTFARAGHTLAHSLSSYFLSELHLRDRDRTQCLCSVAARVERLCALQVGLLRSVDVFEDHLCAFFVAFVMVKRHSFLVLVPYSGSLRNKYKVMMSALSSV